MKLMEIMPKDGSIVRQGTFNTAPADTISTNSIKRGDIEIPIVLSDTENKHSRTKKTKKGDITDTKVTRSSKDPRGSSLPIQNVPEPGRTEAGVTTTVPSRSQLHTTKARGQSNSPQKPSPRGKLLGENKEADVSKSSNHLTDSSRSRFEKGSIKNNKDGRKNSQNKQNGVTENQYDVKNRASNVYRKRSLSRYEEAGSPSRGSPNPQKEAPRYSDQTDLKVKPGNSTSLQKSPPFGNKKTKYVEPDDSTVKDGYVSKPDILSPSRYKDVNVPSPSEGTFDGSMRTGNVASHQSKGPQRLPRVAPFSTEPEMSRSTLKQKPQDYVDSNHQKLYELVQLERDGLLRAEVVYKKRIKQLEDESKAYLKDAEAISDKNTHLQLRIDELESNSSLHGESQKENRDLLVRCEKLERENQSVHTENQKLKSDISDLKNKIEEITGDVDELQKKFSLKESELKRDIHDLHETNSKLESDYKTLMAENSHLMEKVTKLISENKDLNSNLDEKNAAFNDLLKTVEKNKNLQDDLKQSRIEVERAQKSRNSLSMELTLVENKCKSLESEKSKLGEAAREKDAEMYKMKDDIRKKKATISDLHNQVEHLTKEIERLKNENDELRKQWKDDSKINEMVDSLHEEVEKKTDINRKLKKEISTKSSLIEDLNRELANANATAMAETDSYREKLALGEKNSIKVENEIKLKSIYIAQLETELFETKMKIDSMKEKVREVEKKDSENRDYHVSDLETSRKSLSEENRRLRQLMVESNIEVTNHNSEKTLLSSRLEKLEQKQMDSEVKVKRLQNWVDVEYSEEDRHVPSQVRTNVIQRRPADRRTTHKVKASQSREEQCRPPHGLPSPSSSPSLPAIDCKIQPMGYFDIYKQKLKLMKVKKLV